LEPVKVFDESINVLSGEVEPDPLNEKERNGPEEMKEELATRFRTRLPWKPLPIPGEIHRLASIGLITVNGDIYGNSSTVFHDNKIIGSVTHIEEWEKYF
jgi:hypothetical protein